MRDDLISRDAVIYYIKGHIHEIITESGEDKNAHTNRVLRALINGVETMPPVNPQEPCGEIVSLEAFKQVMWERDIAIEQLKELGYGFGQKIEPCGDAISRQAVLDGIEELKRSPWATDKRGNGFEYLITEALDVVADLCVKQASSVNKQEPKTGHWILDETDNSITCDKCGCLIWANDISNGEAYYCPNCGARMESEDKE